MPASVPAWAWLWVRVRLRACFRSHLYAFLCTCLRVRAHVLVSVCFGTWDLQADREAPWRRQWQPTPALLPGKSHGWRCLVGCSPWGREESDTTERLLFHFSLSCIGEGNGNPLQCSCLENPRDGGAWLGAVYGVAQSRTRLKRLSSREAPVFLTKVQPLSLQPTSSSLFSLFPPSPHSPSFPTLGSHAPSLLTCTIARTFFGYFFLFCVTRASSECQIVASEVTFLYSTHPN